MIPFIFLFICYTNEISLLNFLGCYTLTCFVENDSRARDINVTPVHMDMDKLAQLRSTTFIHGKIHMDSYTMPLSIYWISLLNLPDTVKYYKITCKSKYLAT